MIVANRSRAGVVSSSMLRAMSSPVRFGFSAVGLAATIGVAGLLTGPAGGQAATSDPLGCAATVRDPDGLLEADAIESAVDTTASRLDDADVRVRVEPSLDGGLDERIEQLREQCDGWDNGSGELADDMVVVMFSVAERETAVYYGADQGPALERRWDAATDDMIPLLQRGDYTGAVTAALTGLRADPISSGAGAATSSSSADDDDNGTGGLIWLVIIAVVVVAIAYAVRNGMHASGSMFGGDGGEPADGWGDNDGDTGGRRSSWFGSGSSSGRRSSFGSSRRSSGSRSRAGGGSRRAGGGSKKW